MRIMTIDHLFPPEGATHYLSELSTEADGPTWVKQIFNSEGVDCGWFEYRITSQQQGWYLISHHKPNWIKEIPARRDAEGMPMGFAKWYDKHHFGQIVDTRRCESCESAWSAALEWASNQQGVVL